MLVGLKKRRMFILTTKLRWHVENALSFDDPRIVNYVGEHFKSDRGQVQYGSGNLTEYIAAPRWRLPASLLEYEIDEKSTCEEEISPHLRAWHFDSSEIIPVCWALEPSIQSRWGMFGYSILLTEHHSIYLSWHTQRRKMLIEVLLGHKHQCFEGNRIFMPDRDSLTLKRAA